MSKNKVKKLIKNNKLLNNIKQQRVFEIQTYKDKICIIERCDEWFSIELNKKEMLELAKVLNEIANEMKD